MQPLRSIDLDDARRRPGRDRAQRRLRGAGRGRGRRSDGRAGPGRRAARALRRRRARADPAPHGRDRRGAWPAALTRRRAGVVAEADCDASLRCSASAPRSPGQPAADVAAITPEITALVDDMIATMYARTRHRAGRAAGRRRRCGSSSSTCRSAATRTGCGCASTRSWETRDGMQLEEEGCLSVPGFTATVARPERAAVHRARPAGRAAQRRGHGAARPRPPARDGSSRRPACSSTGCAASAAR